MTQYDMTKVHEASLEILKEIDRICRKYKIQYMLDSGSLLGAVRHQGFIPWDDDADVAFTRKNYEAFLKVVRRELPDTMELLMPWDFKGGQRFYDFVARIYYKNSRIHKDSPEVRFYEAFSISSNFNPHSLPQNKIKAETTRFLHKMIYGMAMGHRYHLDFGKYSLFHKLAVRGLSIAGRLVPMKLLFVLQRKLALKDRKCKSSLMYYSNYQPDYLYVTVQRKWCEEVVDLEFCGVNLMAPKHWHEMLTGIYGDYQKLPPKEQRVPAHSTIEIQVNQEKP